MHNESLEYSRCIAGNYYFVRTATKNIKYVTDALESRIIADYSSSDAAAFRDSLLSKNMTVRTVKRVFSSVRSIVNLSIIAGSPMRLALMEGNNSPHRSLALNHL